MNFIIFCSLISFFGVLLVMPSVIKLAIKKRILTGGGGRNSHEGFTPNIGGIAIFISLLLSSLFFFSYYIETNTLADLKKEDLFKFRRFFIVIGCSILLFIVGLADDLTSLSSSFRFLIQLIISFSLVYFGDVRIESFHNIFGLGVLPHTFSVIFSMIVVVFIINSFNLTDGLDTLATSLGIFILFSFSIIFFLNNHIYDGTLAVCGLSSLLAFWFYNRPPAKIFMGDSGSLVIGFIIAYCALKVCNLPIDSEGTINPVFVLCILAYPSVDTIRVFIVRILNRKSPFSADRNHIHHILVDKDFNHGWASFFAVMYAIILSLICYLIRDYATLSFFVMLTLAVVFIVLPMASFTRSTTKRILSIF